MVWAFAYSIGKDFTYIDFLMKTLIISIIYNEKSWKHTHDCIEKTGRQVIYIDRNGTGSLSKAYNEALEMVRKITDKPQYLWMLTNVTFEDGTLEQLENLMDNSEYSIIHPCFKSDHEFCHCGEGEIETVPFVEFTAPIVRTDVMLEFLLNEKMPYWGHDLDFGHRLRESGKTLGVAKNVSIGHTYIRNSLIEQVTKNRMLLRQSTNVQTRMELARLYGKNWNEKLMYHG